MNCDLKRSLVDQYFIFTMDPISSPRFMFSAGHSILLLMGKKLWVNTERAEIGKLAPS